MPGKLYIISAPSGAGKTSLVAKLVQRLDNIMVSVSYTTRPKRASETEGINYHFVNDTQFQQMIDGAEFLEFATVFEYSYGTGKAFVDEKLAQGIDVILEIDWQGASQIRQLRPESIGIFILPPSIDDLKKRLMARDQDSISVIERRIKEAKVELAHYHEYDYLVVNDQFDQALNDLIVIIQANRLATRPQQIKLAAVLTNLIAK